MPSTTSGRVGNGVDLHCVNCGWGVTRLFVQYSPGNIRLMKCGNCEAVADPYIECEFMILLIDLILHKTKAYRHLLYNMLNLEANYIKGIFWKSTLFYFLLEAFRNFHSKRSIDDWDFPRNFLMSIMTCGKVCLDILLGNFMFVFIVLLGTRALLNSSFSISRCKELTLAILISSYFKLFLIAMMVWDFPSSGLLIIDIFVLSSNAVALRVLTHLRTARCIGVCFSAYAAKVLTNWLLSLLLH